MIDPSVRDVLSDVYDPCCRDKGISVVDMGLLHRAEIDGGAARVELMLTSGWCPFATTVLGDIESAVRSLPGVDDRHGRAGLARGLVARAALRQRQGQAALPPRPGDGGRPSVVRRASRATALYTTKDLP